MRVQIECNVCKARRISNQKHDRANHPYGRNLATQLRALLERVGWRCNEREDIDLCPRCQ